MTRSCRMGRTVCCVDSVDGTNCTLYYGHKRTSSHPTTACHILVVLVLLREILLSVISTYDTKFNYHIVKNDKFTRDIDFVSVVSKTVLLKTYKHNYIPQS